MDVLLVNTAGSALIAWIVWYFFLSRRREEAVAAAFAGAQEIHVRVKGGYIPDVIVARAGLPLRIHFRREETSACSEEVVFPDFGIRRLLPAFETTVVEIPASKEGTYGFACGMDMLHGTLVVGERALASTTAAPHGQPPHGPAREASTERAVDPICGMTVEPPRAAGSSVRDGRTFYFCSLGCKTRFDEGGGPQINAPHARHGIPLGVGPKDE